MNFSNKLELYFDYKIAVITILFNKIVIKIAEKNLFKD